MLGIAIGLPPLALIRASVAAVWLYEGLWCKLLGGARSQVDVVTAVPRLGPRFGPPFLKALGLVEVAIAVWVLTGIAPGLCAIAQTALLVALNVNGLLWARRIIHDPAGMVVKNIAFLVLAWVCGAMPATPAVTMDTAWQAGRLGPWRGPQRLLFGHMYEDVEIERAAFHGRGRVFCIASAGATALALADRHDVVACDINPVQLAYAERRAAGRPAGNGRRRAGDARGARVHAARGLEGRRSCAPSWLCPTSLNSYPSGPRISTPAAFAPGLTR